MKLRLKKILLISGATLLALSLSAPIGSASAKSNPYGHYVHSNWYPTSYVPKHYGYHAGYETGSSIAESIMDNGTSWGNVSSYVRPFHNSANYRKGFKKGISKVFKNDKDDSDIATSTLDTLNASVGLNKSEVRGLIFSQEESYPASKIKKQYRNSYYFAKGFLIGDGIRNNSSLHSLYTAWTDYKRSHGNISYLRLLTKPQAKYYHANEAILNHVYNYNLTPIQAHKYERKAFKKAHISLTNQHIKFFNNLIYSSPKNKVLNPTKNQAKQGFNDTLYLTPKRLDDGGESNTTVNIFGFKKNHATYQTDNHLKSYLYNIYSPEWGSKESSRINTQFHKNYQIRNHGYWSKRYPNMWHVSNKNVKNSTVACYMHYGMSGFINH